MVIDAYSMRFQMGLAYYAFMFNDAYKCETQLEGQRKYDSIEVCIINIYETN
jgi:hypothetical protein